MKNETEILKKDKKFFYPPDNGLGEPKRKFNETFSAWDAIKEHFDLDFPK